MMKQLEHGSHPGANSISKTNKQKQAREVGSSFVGKLCAIAWLNKNTYDDEPGVAYVIK